MAVYEHEDFYLVHALDGQLADGGEIFAEIDQEFMGFEMIMVPLMTFKHLLIHL